MEEGSIYRSLDSDFTFLVRNDRKSPIIKAKLQNHNFKAIANSAVELSQP